MTLNYGVYNIYLHIGIATTRAGEINGADGPGVEHGDDLLIAENNASGPVTGVNSDEFWMAILYPGLNLPVYLYCQINHFLCFLFSDQARALVVANISLAP
jgi:hypothetical protein